MRTTYPEAQFNFMDVTALADSKVVSTSAKSFAITALYQKDVRQTVYGTMELNQFILDGSREIFPVEQPEDVPFWSDEKSDADGRYAKNPTLEISFTKAHSSIGLTLYFAEDIPAEVLITWYTLYGTKLDTATFYPDSKEYFCRHHVQNYGKVEIEFISSSWPYRYAKMDYITYGQMWMLGRDNIKAANVYEEIDPISATLSINTAKIELIDTSGEFALDKENGLWKSLQKEQEIALTEYVNDVPVECGTFFMDTWDCQSSLVKFTLIDRIGLMDQTNYYGGRIYENEYAGVIISDIMESAGVVKYSIEEDVYYTKLSGWLAIQSHRAALQQVVFACGAVADCSRSSWIRIYKQDRYVSHTIGLDRKFPGTKIALEEYISAVSVAYKEYVLAEKDSQISKSILPVGTNRIEFSAPYLAESITVSVGNIQEVHTNYMVIVMSEQTECIITGRKYEAVESVRTVSVPLIESGETAKTKSYQGCTLMNAAKAEEIAKRILEHHSMRQTVEMRFINEGEAVGNWCDVALTGGGHSTTGIISQTLDLTGGNIATAKCQGYSRTVTAYYFTGTEIYAGEDGIF